MSSSAGPELTIGELSRRTGVPVAVLRTWEARHGFPRPVRSAAGQRRYREADCDLVARVVAGRRDGLSLRAAVARVADADPSTATDRTIFAGLRRRHPELVAHTLTKRVLGALTMAIEDESVARADRPLLVGAFQRRAFFDQAGDRWRELARTAEQTVVFADFPSSVDRPGGVSEVALASDAAQGREWALVCDHPDRPACVAGWELPPRSAGDRRRRFEVVWSTDPLVVRHAARVAVTLAGEQLPALAERLAPRLAPAPPPAAPELRRAAGVFDRLLDHLGA